MKTKQDSPGVYIPPPLFYALIFLAAVFIQRISYINDALFHQKWIKGAGIFLILIAAYFMITSLARFLKTRNTLILIKPATSLQRHGVYGISRNPMYLGLAFLYLGLACLIGNWWHFIFFPLLILIIQVYVINSEEQYLERAFGSDFIDYKNKVRRWL